MRAEGTDFMSNRDEIMTVKDVAAFLKMSTGQIYEQTREKTRARRTYPIPFMQINGNLRFRRSHLNIWLDAQAKRTTPVYPETED